MSNRPGYPLYAAINITTKSNLDCRYCYLQPRSGLDMSLQDFRFVIDDLNKNDLFFVHISGGEPFIHPDFTRIVDYACAKFNDVSILTNGMVIGEAQLKYLRELRSTIPIKIQVSLDSIYSRVNSRTRSVNSEVIIKNIKRLSNAGILHAVSMVVTKYNIGTLVDSILKLSEYVKYYHIICIQDTEYDPRLEEKFKPDGKLLMELWEELKGIQDEYDLDISKPSDFELSNYKGCAYGAPCAAASSYLVIDPDLNLRPCDKLNSVILGNMHNGSIREIWNGETARRFVDNEIPLCMSKRSKAGM